MATFILPTSTEDADYEISTELDGSEYTLRFTWNARELAWMMSIFDADETILAAGRKVVVGMPLTRSRTDPRMPPGEFVALDLNNQDVDPGRDDLADGQRVILMYLEAADVAEA